MKLLYLLMAASLLVLPKDARQPAAPATQSGRLSKVTFLGIERGEVPARPPLAPGAQDGLVFHFLVEPTSSAEGRFTLSALRDFKVDGRRYSDISEERLGKRFISEAIVDDVSDFMAVAGPRLFERVPPKTAERALVMSVTISGAPLRDDALGNVQIDVGWGNKTELFDFSFSVPVK